MQFTPLSDLQVRNKIDLLQSYEAYREARKTALSYRGSMHWSSINGREYLVHKLNARSTRSHGPRSEKTETVLAEFTAGKERARSREKQLADTIKSYAGIAKSLRINRAPALVTALLRKLDDHGILGNNLTVIGTHSLYAYESAAGVVFDAELMATNDVDLLFDSNSRIRFALSPELATSGLMGILKSVDSTFSILSQKSYRAVNNAGFMVDFIRATPTPPWRSGTRNKISLENHQKSVTPDLIASDIEQLKWLVSSEKFEAFIIGSDGYPARIVCHDPRAFATYKLWLSEQENRDSSKARRDYAQALAVAQLTCEYLPHLTFNPEQLRNFPIQVASQAQDRFKFEL